MAETITILLSNYPLIQNFKKETMYKNIKKELSCIKKNFRFAFKKIKILKKINHWKCKQGFVT